MNIMHEQDLARLVRERVKAEGGVNNFARHNHVLTQEVSYALGCRRGSRRQVSARLANLLGFRRVEVFVPIEGAR